MANPSPSRPRNLVEAHLLYSPTLTTPQAKQDYYLQFGLALCLYQPYGGGQKDKGDTLTAYLEAMDPNGYQHSKSKELCPECGSPLYREASDSILQCEKCGVFLSDVGHHQTYNEYMDQSSLTTTSRYTRTKAFQKHLHDVLQRLTLEGQEELLSTIRFSHLQGLFGPLEQQFNARPSEAKPLQFPPYAQVLLTLATLAGYHDLVKALKKAPG